MKRQKPLNRQAFARSGKRASALIESMLKEMQRGLRDPSRMETPEWAQLFGAKQSMVVNVQKLVQALAALPGEDSAEYTAETAPQEGDRLTAEEMRLLTQWLTEGNGGE